MSEAAAAAGPLDWEVPKSPLEMQHKLLGHLDALGRFILQAYKALNGYF